MITGGDRTDIHTAALESPVVERLILTGGHRPPPTVLGTAAEKGVTVLLCAGDTLTTPERAEEVVSGGRTRDERTVDVMGALLADHADVDALLGGERDDG